MLQYIYHFVILSVHTVSFFFCIALVDSLPISWLYTLGLGPSSVALPEGNPFSLSRGIFPFTKQCSTKRWCCLLPRSLSLYTNGIDLTQNGFVTFWYHMMNWLFDRIIRWVDDGKNQSSRTSCWLAMKKEATWLEMLKSDWLSSPLIIKLSDVFLCSVLHFYLRGLSWSLHWC